MPRLWRRARGAVYLDIDVATEPVVQAGLVAAGLSRDDRDSPTYKGIFREPVYEALWQLAEANLGHLPVVVVGPFTSECRDESWPASLEARFGVPVEVHFVHCAPEVRKERMADRRAARDLAKLADWDCYLETVAEERPPFPHQWIETG